MIKIPSLQRAAAVSAALHLSVFIIAMIIFRQANQFVMPSPYTVSLVSPSTPITKIASTPPSKAVKAIKKEKPAIPRVKPPVEKVKEKTIDHKRIEDRISELEAKKKIERIVKLRSMIDLKGKIKPDSNVSSTKGTIFDSYYATITAEIWQEWIYPDLGEKNLETVVHVKIKKDGTIIIQGVEKSSGNRLFDRSALKALSKATPVSPPPYEMDIGIRFYP